MSPRPVRRPRKNGPDAWWVRFRLGDGTQTSETFDTRAEADEFCRDCDDLGTDEAVALRADRANHAGALSLDQLAEEFFAWKAKKVRSDRTVADYRRDYRNWIAPRFGRRRAGSITDAEVQRWVDDMADGMDDHRPAAPKSIGDRHALLHGIYAYGQRVKRNETNPCIGTDLPKKQKGLPKGMRPNEWAALHAALCTMSQDAADVALGLLATGWRWSEVAALSVGQVEDHGDELYVTMDRVVRRNAAGQNVIVEEGKGQASIRRVRVDPDAAAMFRRRIAGKRLDAFVFTTPVSEQNGMGGGQWHYNNFRSRYWEPAVDVANLGRRPTPHWLRHTHVVWMAMSGASLPELQNRIGHQSIKTTLDVYGRMLTDVSPAALAGFAAMRGEVPALERG